MDWRTRAVLALFSTILLLGFLLLESQMIDSPRRVDFDAMLAELNSLKQNVSDLQRQLHRVEQKLPKERENYSMTHDRRVPFTARCGEMYKSLLPVTSRDLKACRVFRFIHVAKNGGTALEEWLENNDLQCLLMKGSFEHVDMQVEFPTRSKGTCYLTMVRDPVERWISGFLSRWRQGCPSHCSNWTKAEEKVFQMFQTPNQLAEAFSSPDPQLRNAADMAHSTIHHLYRGYATYFPYGKIMLRHLLFAGLICNLETDAFAMLRAIGVPDESLLGVSPIKRVHQNPVSYQDLQTGLSAQALRNIQRKVKDDYDVLKLMVEENIIESQNISSICQGGSRQHP